MEQSKKVLSEAEVERIKSLPKRSVTVGKESKSGYFDAENYVLYQCKEDGSLTGVSFNIKRPSTTPTPTPQSSSPAEAEKKNPDEEKEKKFGKAQKIGAGVALAAAVLVGCSMVFGQSGQTQQDPSILPGVSKNAVGPETVKVIRTTRALIPGQQVSMADFETVEMSSSNYNQFAMFARDLCLWSRADQLVGGYVNQYMPDGHYIELSDIGSSAPVSVPPWAADVTYSWEVVLPEQSRDGSITFGSIVDVLVKETTNNQVASGAPSGDGVTTTIDEINRIETHALNGMTVVDVLNAQGNSLYATYQAYANIPLSERREYLASAMRDDPDLEEQISPCYVILNATDKQSEIISKLGGKNSYSVSIKTVIGSDTSSEAKAQCINDFAGVKDSIDAAIAYNKQLDAEEQAAIQQAIKDAAKTTATPEGSD